MRRLVDGLAPLDRGLGVGRGRLGLALAGRWLAVARGGAAAEGLGGGVEVGDEAAGIRRRLARSRVLAGDPLELRPSRSAALELGDPLLQRRPLALGLGAGSGERLLGGAAGLALGLQGGAQLGGLGAGAALAVELVLERRARDRLHAQARLDRRKGSLAGLDATFGDGQRRLQDADPLAKLLRVGARVSRRTLELALDLVLGLELAGTQAGLLARRRELPADVGQRGLELGAAAVPGGTRLGEATIGRLEVRARRRSRVVGGRELRGTSGRLAAGAVQLRATVRNLAASGLQLRATVRSLAASGVQLGSKVGGLMAGGLQLGAAIRSLAASGLQFGAPFVQRGTQRPRSCSALGLKHGEPHGVAGAGDLARAQTHLPIARARAESGR